MIALLIVVWALILAGAASVAWVGRDMTRGDNPLFQRLGRLLLALAAAAVIVVVYEVANVLVRGLS